VALSYNEILLLIKPTFINPVSNQLSEKPWGWGDGVNAGPKFSDLVSSKSEKCGELVPSGCNLKLYLHL